ncbi:MAG: hypothetical protein HYS23_06740 [Geobacter sp.]|nr:hypothetical protein [Geobacter sp.]
MELILADMLPAALFGCAFVAIFAGGEMVRRAFPASPELSRKFVHFCGGLTAIAFPFFLKSPWTVLLLGLAFAGIIILTKRLGLLKSVHGVARTSSGALYFPVAITILFFLGHDRHAFYIISVLALTVSDTMAALVGSRYGSITYEVEDSKKSLEGSLVFFFVTYLCVHIPLLLLTDTGRLQSVLTALVIALLVTGFEAISLAGSDNIFVPLGAFFILVKMTRHDLASTIEHTGILFLIIAVTVVLSILQKILKPSGLIGMILVNYAAWSLCDFSWFLPLILAQILLFLLVSGFRQKVPEDITNYQVKVLYYSATVPVLLIFAANAAEEYGLLYLPYLTAIVTQLTLIFAYFLSISDGSGPLAQSLRRVPILRGILCTATSTLTIAALPAILYLAMPWWVSLGLVAAGTIAAFPIFQAMTARLSHDNREWTLRQRIRLICTGAAAAGVFVVQMLVYK